MSVEHTIRFKTSSRELSALSPKASCWRVTDRDRGDPAAGRRAAREANMDPEGPMNE